MKNKILRTTLLLLCFCAFACSENNSRRHSATDPVEIQAETQKPKMTFVQNAEYSVQAVGITDGDTFKGLTADNQQVKFRLYGIDAPEKKQAFGNSSKQYLSDLIFDKTVTVKIQKKQDRYGRPIVWVFTPEGKDVSAEMLRAGMAWHYKKYSNDAEYAELENQACNAKIGLWADKNAVAPWEFRKSKRLN